jgi:ribosomal protein S18 acetylase RimI-like enzyme
MDSVIETLGRERRNEVLEVLGAAFAIHPLLPADQSGRTSRRLVEIIIDALDEAPDACIFGIRRQERLDCAAFVHDAAYAPHGIALLRLLFGMVRILGWRMTYTFARVLSAKPKAPERRLELMIIGTRDDAQQAGLGRAMIRHVFSFARARGYESVVLEVAKETPAFGFYLREGFQVEKEIALPAMPLCLVRRPLDDEPSSSA